MLAVNAANSRVWSMLGSRGTFGLAMLEATDSSDNIMVLTADLCNSSGLDRFRKAHPDKFLNIGIAEQNMVGIAAGLAKEGFNTFATSFSNFAAMRAYEQVRIHLGYMGLNIKIIGLASGLAMGQAGNTHFGLEDLALMRAIPGLTVLAPADGAEVVKTVNALVRREGPAYVRLTGAMNNPIVYRDDYDFTIGKAVKLKEGTDIALFACGTMVHASLVAAKQLEETGISAAVVNMHTIKPIDTEALDRACESARLLVTVEEHSVVGGLGGAVAEYLAQHGSSPRQLLIGLPDNFGTYGDYKYLLERYGLTGEQIADTIMRFLNG